MTSIFLVVDWRKGGRAVSNGAEGRGAILAAWGAATLGDLPASHPCSPVPPPGAQRTVRSRPSFWPPTPALLLGDLGCLGTAFMGPGVGGGDGKTALLTSFIGQLTDGCLGSGPGAVITVLVRQTAEHPRGACARVCGAGGSPYSCPRRENQSFPWLNSYYG